ncbi:MAG: class I SAM-dependent methyltransferase [Thermoprotei archaeon]|nr:MAG: class I SAM-dependent methyltransferase [Thermoprotei archaeon]RLF01033.1 MAG: class I SAM-dependent methyltransferase [Thermoprotei archaeon]HDI74450.1 methyltransferase domain-containing protein [Thermoprotei archaeon]
MSSAAKYYNIISSVYDELYGGEQRRKYELLYRFLGKGLLLDAGCGTGLLSEFLAERKLCCEYIGVDVSIGMIQVARRKGRRGSFIVGCVEYLPFRRCVFDYVVAVTLVQNLLDIGVFIKEAVRVLRKGGVLIVTVLLKKRDLVNDVLDAAFHNGLRLMCCIWAPRSADEILVFVK